MRIFFSVGEPSGDLHASNLIRHLNQQDPGIECVGFGGPKMQNAGCELLFELTSMAVMFLEALKNLRFFFKLVDQADEYFENNDVDAVVLIDYPGFNFYIAKKAKQRGIPVFYYGVPQAWAWAPWRVRKIRRLVDHVLCKLPFEADWFRQRNCRATYVGHPYFDQLVGQDFDEAMLSQMKTEPNLVVLLPGSRDQEVATVLPILLKSAELIQKQTECRVAIASYNEKQAAVAREMVSRSTARVEVFCEKTPELVRSAKLCLACSGSVSLELMYYRKPTIIVFKVKRWAMLAQAFLLKTKFITLVNLIAAKDIRRKSWRVYDPDHENAEPTVMPEYLGSGDPSKRVAERAVTWLTDAGKHQAVVAELDELAQKYAKPGATRRAAEYILRQLAPSRSACLAKADDAGEKANKELRPETNQNRSVA